ncbi:MAG: TlpA disulfide reductase family protein [Bacteroidota bacterium]
MKKIISLTILSLMLACAGEKTTSMAQTELAAGEYRLELQLTSEQTLPFELSLQKDADQWRAIIHNAAENIEVDEVLLTADSLFIRMPVFDSEFRLAIESEQQLSGAFYNYSRGLDYQIPAKMFAAAQARFTTAQPNFEIDGNWEAVFSDELEDEYPAVGVFKQEADYVSGTFLTETGDYRFLEGAVNGDKLQLACFDGAHAFLFEGAMEGDTLRGTFWSGNHWQEPFWMVKNPEASLRSPEELTYLKEGYDKLSFSFPDLAGKPVSLSDQGFQDKVVLIQIMGSWCPNCLDETQLYKQWYERYHEQGLEIVALAFERSRGDLGLAQRNVQRLVDKLELAYPFLIANADNDKAAAAAKLPMLNAILSYPTSIYIDRKGEIRRIHTGFNGPGTGDIYLRYREDYEGFIEKLLAE